MGGEWPTYRDAKCRFITANRPAPSAASARWRQRIFVRSFVAAELAANRKGKTKMEEGESNGESKNGAGKTMASLSSIGKKRPFAHKGNVGVEAAGGEGHLSLVTRARGAAAVDGDGSEREEKYYDSIALFSSCNASPTILYAKKRGRMGRRAPFSPRFFGHLPRAIAAN